MWGKTPTWIIKMKKLLLHSQLIVLIGVLFILISSLIEFIDASWLTIKIIIGIWQHQISEQAKEIKFIQVMDNYLIATGLLIFSLGLYQIFIEPLPVAKALRFQTVHQLKTSLANVIVLTMSVHFLGELQLTENADRLLSQAIAIALVSAVLIFFSRSHEYKGKMDKHDSE